MEEGRNEISTKAEAASSGPEEEISPESPRNVTVTFNFQHSGSSSEADNEHDSIEYSEPMNRLTVIGRVRKCSSLTMMEYLLFVATIVTLLVSICFSTLSFVKGDSEDSVFSVLTIVNAAFILFYLTHGVFTEEPFELIALTSSLVMSTVLYVANYLTTVDENMTVLNFVVAILSSVLTLLTISISLTLAWKYWITGNLIFRIVGADMKLQRMCRLLLLAQSLLAFDAQWTLIILVLVFQNGFNEITSEQLLLVCVGVFLIALWLFIGYLAMRLESMYLTWIFVGTSMFQPIYVLYLTVKSMMIVNYELDHLKMTLYIAAFVCLSVHFTLLAVISSVSANYGKGLSEKVYGTKSASAPEDPEDDAPVAENVTETAPLLREGGSSPSQRTKYASIAE